MPKTIKRKLRKFIDKDGKTLTIDISHKIGPVTGMFVGGSWFQRCNGWRDWKVGAFMVLNRLYYRAITFLWDDIP